MVRKFSLLLALMVVAGFTQSQPAENVPMVTIRDGKIKFEGTDALGAEVFIEYNYDYIKTYQERTIDGVTTFAKFRHGRLIESGTRYYPTFEFGRQRALLFKSRS